MAEYFDSSAPGAGGNLTASKTFNLGAEVKFYLSCASNIISGQSSGPSVAFTVYSKKVGRQTFNVDYGTTNTNYEVALEGYMVEMTVPTGGNPVSLRVVIDKKPTPVTVQTVAAAITGKASVSIDGQTVGVAPATALAGSAIDPRQANIAEVGGSAVATQGSGVQQSNPTGTTVVNVGLIIDSGVTAATAIFPSALIPASTPCLFRIFCNFASAGTLAVTRKNATGPTITEKLNNGNALQAGCSYTFDVRVTTNDAINVVYSTSCTCNILSVDEDNTLAWSSPPQGNLNVVAQTPIYQVFNPAAPTGIASTSAFKMLGIAAETGGPQFTPTQTGNLIIRFKGFLYASSGFAAGDGAILKLYYGLVSGGVPANGASATGTQLGSTSPAMYPGYPNSIQSPYFFEIEVPLSGLALGAPIWLDLAIETITGGTFTIDDPMIAVEEA